MSCVAAVMVLYNPSGDTKINIFTCLEQVDILYIIDNSEQPSDFIKEIKKLKKIHYIWNGENKGLAHALNQGADLAIADQYDFLLTLDQDSCVEPRMVEVLRDAFKKYPDTICILAPGELVGTDLPTRIKNKGQKVLSVWTSGSLVNLSVFCKVGPFREDLFIDFIDHEFCLRANLAGYDIYRIPNAKLRHRLGENAWRIVAFGKSFWVTNHSPIRRYYIMRNRLLVRSLYDKSFPGFFRDDRNYMFLEILSILFFEKNKLEKLKMMVKGVRDFKSRSFGKYNG